MAFRRLNFVLSVVFFSGCGKHSLPQKSGTGADVVARSYFEALLRGEWHAAYDLLDPTSRTRWSEAQFAARGQSAMRQIGFTPTSVSVAVSEVGDGATAIAVYRGISGASPRQFKDGTSLKKTDQVWLVILRNSFGDPSPAPVSRKRRKTG